MNCGTAFRESTSPFTDGTVSFRSRFCPMHGLRWAGLVVLFTTALLSCTPVWAAPPAEEFTTDELARGRRQFTVHCARCHGMQGLGGTGPSLARPTLTQAPDLPALVAVIENGIPGTGMPSTWLLPPRDRRAIAGFVRSLGAAAEAPLAGDPERGREWFKKAACAKCHTIAGEGGVTGPDLSEVGNRRGAERLLRMVTEPGVERIVTPEGYTEYLPVKLTTIAGRVVEGLRVNEDGFTLQVRDLENQIHSFRKTEIREITRGFSQSIMPGFGSMFNAAEIDDLVAFLAGLKGIK